MGVSLYYSVERSVPLTNEEDSAIEETVSKFQQSFEFQDEGEDFCIYELNSSEPQYIFRGATKLPMGDVEDMLSACLHWAACLTAIRHIIKDGDWSVHLDDHDLLWCDETGWYLSDEF
ncbi:hypothetical protein I6N90_13860 [Paenibacillus sp. GSMTC-2017]|uniref:hypothetical protein n=1 Tax=Paenibacillus sp. GSMTC-2017 TaxID=2794350 RepID=UPI0018D73B1A|nr:hypothetical protein [Paenibacillus sp. GSMTC-2017]MBH5318885.1 hypothetical protein [Paenibacillus sp. GSMTC-2017]